jgi:hypothetical protein
MRFLTKRMWSIKRTTYLFIFRNCGEDYCFYIETKYWMKMMWMTCTCLKCFTIPQIFHIRIYLYWNKILDENDVDDMYMFEMFYNTTDIPYTNQYHTNTQGSSWPWLHGSWIYNYLCNQCILPLMLWVKISIRARCTTICDKVCRWFSPGPPVFSTNKIHGHDIIVESGVQHHQTNKLIWNPEWDMLHTYLWYQKINFIRLLLT